MGLVSEHHDPDAVRPDRKSEEFFEPLAEVIAEALSTRGSDEDRLNTVEDAHGVAEPIAAAVLDRFVVRPRPAERVHDHVSRGVPAGGGIILEVRDLSVVYGTKKAVDRVSLQITRGEIFGLLGPNGAGKTSTLSAIEGLIKPQVRDGLPGWRRHPAPSLSGEGQDGRATAGDQLPVAAHDQADREAVRRALRHLAVRQPRSPKAWRRSGSGMRRANRSSSFPAGSSSGSRCTSPSSTTRHCCCSTSRRLASIPSRVASSGVGSSTSDSRAGAFF